MPFSSLKSTFEIIMQLNCVWMFWHSECESRGLGRLPCCTLTVMSPQASSLRVSFIILSMLGYCKVPLPSPAVNQRPPVPSLWNGACVARATGPCHRDSRTAGFHSRLAAPSDASGAFLTEEASAPRDGLLICAQDGVGCICPSRFVWPPVVSVHSSPRGREGRSLGHLAMCPAFQ